MRNARIIAIAIATTTIALTSCKSTKLTQTKDTNLVRTEVQAVHNDFVKSISTKIYGDTLSGISYLPVFFDKADSTGTDSTSVESAGIKLKLKVTPKRNANGSLVGNVIDFKAIAKPVATSDTNTVLTSHKEVQSKTKETVKDKIATTTQTGINSFPWGRLMWIVLAVLALYLIIKNVIKV